MGAIDPTESFHDRRGQHARFAQHLQRDACADDVHNGIHRAHFVKMHLLGRFAVNPAFGVGNPLEHGDRFFLYPLGERTLGDQLFDFSERAVFVVVMMMLVFV